MLNRSGITKTTYGAPVQILANVELQASVGCVVPQSMGVTVGAKKIAKAGTPVAIDLMSRTTPVTAEGEKNAVLLHDVDVTAGNANGTALIFGFVNVNRLESDVVTALGDATAVGNVTLMKD